MGRQVILVWELGAGHGHVVPLRAIAEALEQKGLEPVYVVQQPGLIQNTTAKVLQAPVWPGTLNTFGPRHARPTVTLGDVLANLGLMDHSSLSGMVRAWDQLLSYLRPAAIVADFSPACLLTAYRRIKTIAIGPGFTLPPHDLNEFPVLQSDAGPPRFDECITLSNVNRVLAEWGRPQRKSLPGVFRADSAFVTSFAEFDPYAPFRKTPNFAPLIPRISVADIPGHEVFFYLSGPLARQASVLDAVESIARAGNRVSLVAPPLEPDRERRLHDAQVVLETKLVTPEEMARRSRLLVSAGGNGLASVGLCTGIPHVALTTDVEKRLNATALEALGCGRMIRLRRDDIGQADEIHRTVVDTLNDHAMLAHCRSIAPRFFARVQDPPQDQIVRAVLNGI